MAAHKSRKIFVVVDFYKEKKVATVPTTWTKVIGEKFYCSWPSGPASADLQRDPLSIPQPQWTTHPVKIFNYYGKFFN